MLNMFLLSVVLTCVQCFPSGDHVWSPPSQVSALDQATLLLSSSDDTTTHDNDPLDNLADLRDIHQFDLDLSNYTDHEAVESADTSNQLIQEFNDHFDILPGMDTRDYNDTGLFLQSEQLETNNDVSSILNPDLYEVVTSPADAEVNTYDEHLLDDEHFDEADQDGMDRKYFQLLENLHKKMHRNKNHNNANSEGDADIEIHEEDNDVMHPLISLTAVRANSMRLTITPKKYSENSMVRLMYKRVPRNKPAQMKHLNDPITEYIHLYRLDQEHFLTNLPMGKYIVCADYTIKVGGVDKVVQHNCFEAFVERPDTYELQGGVVGIIALAMLTLISCLGYAIYQRCIKMKEETENSITTKH